MKPGWLDASLNSLERRRLQTGVKIWVSHITARTGPGRPGSRATRRVGFRLLLYPEESRWLEGPEGKQVRAEMEWMGFAYYPCASVPGVGVPWRLLAASIGFLDEFRASEMRSGSTCKNVDHRTAQGGWRFESERGLSTLHPPPPNLCPSAKSVDENPKHPFHGSLYPQISQIGADGIRGFALMLAQHRPTEALTRPSLKHILSFVSVASFPSIHHRQTRRPCCPC
jgi:hypothetical protein